MQPDEPIVQALEQEIQEETGISSFQVVGFLTVVEKIFPIGKAKFYIP